MTRARTKTQVRVEAFVVFCIEHQVKVAIIMWLLIIIGLISLWRMT